MIENIFSAVSSNAATFYYIAGGAAYVVTIWQALRKPDSKQMKHRKHSRKAA